MLVSINLGSQLDPSSVGSGMRGGAGGEVGGGLSRSDGGGGLGLGREDAHAHTANTYPLFYIRYVGMLVSTPFVLENLCVLAGADSATGKMVHFLNASIWCEVYLLYW
jgi:hypothetical protein